MGFCRMSQQKGVGLHHVDEQSALVFHVYILLLLVSRHNVFKKPISYVLFNNLINVDIHSWNAFFFDINLLCFDFADIIPLVL